MRAHAVDGGAPPRRTCVVTREEHAAEDLVRVIALPDGSLGVDYRARLGGRGAWLLPRREVLATAEARPAVLRRALDAEGLRCEGLLDAVRESNLRAVLDALSLAARSGRIIGGGEQLSSIDEDIIGFIVACNASPKSVAAARARAPGLAAWEVPLDREALGQRVGKGPRAVLGIRSGGPSGPLSRELRRMAELR